MQEKINWFQVEAGHNGGNELVTLIVIGTFIQYTYHGAAIHYKRGMESNSRIREHFPGVVRA